MTETIYIIELIRASLEQRKAEEKPENILWEKLYELVGVHMVSSITFYQIDKLEKKPPQQIYRLWKEKIEEYKELLADGWEGAVATEGGKILYEYMADPVLDKWKISMDQMRNYFQNNGLEFPHIYIAAEGELLNSVEIYFPQYGITGYAVVEYNVKKAARELADDAVLDMGMIKAKYIYKDLESDLKELQYEGKSMAMRFQTVESSSPSNIYNTSIYRLNTYLETISNSENAQVTTFQGYRDYQETFENDNAELIQQYKAKLEKIENEMKKLEQENDRNYKNALSYY